MNYIYFLARLSIGRSSAARNDGNRGSHLAMQNGQLIDPISGGRRNQRRPCRDGLPSSGVHAWDVVRTPPNSVHRARRSRRARRSIQCKLKLFLNFTVV